MKVLVVYDTSNSKGMFRSVAVEMPDSYSSEKDQDIYCGRFSEIYRAMVDQHNIYSDDIIMVSRLW